MTKALIIKKYWLDQIFDNNKIWEMRSKPTKIRGRIKLIASTTGMIFGEVDIIDCVKINATPLNAFIKLHKVTDYNLLNKWCYAWVLSNPKKYKNPIKYNHPKGAVIWVNIP